jgi:hypothetical protein
MLRLKEVVSTIAIALPPAAQQLVKYQWTKFNEVTHLQVSYF